MIIIFHKQTGEILAGFPETFILPDTFQVGQEKDFNSYEQLILSAEIAQDFENPYTPHYIHDYKVEFNENKKPVSIKQFKNLDKYQGQLIEQFQHKQQKNNLTEKL
jgi:hypothetical protein